MKSKQTWGGTVLFLGSTKQPFLQLVMTNVRQKTEYLQCRLFCLTLFPMAGGRCVSRQFKIDSIQAGMKFSGLQLNDNSFLSIL